MSADVINPFDDLIVKEPRRREPTVNGLNEEPFREILRRFEILSGGSAPRELRRLGEAQLVTSVQAGYGKSHLIGRLFHELHGRATLIYVMPFQNPATVFQSLMMTIAREMHFPDRADAGAWNREEPTQLDQLAHAVLAQILADLVEGGRDVKTEEENRAEVIARLRNDAMGSFNRGVAGANWADWMRSYFTRLLPLFEEALARRGLTLSAPGAWLRVLRAYAFAPFDLTLRRACLDWLTGQPLETTDLEALGLKSSEAPNVEADPSETNEVCRHRVMDLCQLAVFYRPFVFCFDQTEVYGHRAPLARAFGMALGRLVDEAANQLTLVTSNQSPWTDRIAPNLENADLDRIAKPFLILKGLDRKQGEDLARLRMESARVAPERQAAFLGAQWLAEIFPSQTNELGARHFLQKCRERWNRAPSRNVPLEELFQQEREKLLAAPKRHLFEPDTLQWLIEEAARAVDGIVVESLTDRYFPVCWQMPQRLCYFGFVSGSFWRQWRAIARAAVENCRANSRPAKAVFFRTPEQPAIPGPKWQVAHEIDAAKAKYLQIITLRVEEVAELYAGKELFADAAQGDIPYSPEEVLKFLAVELGPWWERLRAPMAKEGEPPSSGELIQPESDLAKQVREIVRAELTMSVEHVAEKVFGARPSRDEVLAACGFTPQIRVQTRADGTVLQWQEG